MSSDHPGGERGTVGRVHRGQHLDQSRVNPRRAPVPLRPPFREKPCHRVGRERIGSQSGVKPVRQIPFASPVATLCVAQTRLKISASLMGQHRSHWQAAGRPEIGPGAVGTSGPSESEDPDNRSDDKKIQRQ